MIKRGLKTFIFFLFSIASFAQNKIKLSEHDSIVSSWKYIHYAPNIVKVIYRPGNYDRGELLSDAVIVKPSTSKAKQKIRMELAGNGLAFTNDTIRITIQSFEHGETNGFEFVLQKDEKIFGGGERALPLNRRGYRLPLYNNPWYGYSEGADALNYSVPFITSSKGYGLFFDNPSKGYIDIGKTNPDVLEYGASSGEINVYVIFGDYQTILQSYHKLTGTQPLPPRWAMGNLMSRFGYTSEAQVKDIYAKMKAENIPVDAIIFDLFWFGDSIKHSLGNLDWINKMAWPDPKKMIADFKKDGVNTILVTEPFFVETSKNYKASKPYLSVDSVGNPYYLTDFYFGKGGLIDIFRKDAQTWFWQFYKKQMQTGVEAWWGDLGEPERHPANLYHNLKDLGHKRLFKADEVHNIYGHNWTKMLYNFYAKEYPNKRLFSLNRSGFAGSQRYSIFPWTGDVSRSWSGLRAQLPILLGMSMSGVPYVHSDAGGFAGGEGDPELYVRWLQFAAFTPIFRPHGTALYEVDKAAFSFPSEAALMEEPWKSIANTVITARYRMLPYNYSLAYQQTTKGQPLMAPLYYYFPSDTTAAKVQDEYMWGESFLVAPILEKSARTKKYYLPKGKWYWYGTRKVFEGMTWREDSIAMEEMPVFIKEGSFIPIDGRAIKGENTTAYATADIPVMYFLSEEPSKYELYLDDGQTKEAIAKQLFELIAFKSSGMKKNRLELSITSNNGNYRGKPQKRLVFFVMPTLKPPLKILINNKEVQLNQNIRMSNNELSVFLSFSGKPVSIKLLW